MWLFSIFFGERKGLTTLVSCPLRVSSITAYREERKSLCTPMFRGLGPIRGDTPVSPCKNHQWSSSSQPRPYSTTTDSYREWSLALQGERDHRQHGAIHSSRAEENVNVCTYPVSVICTDSPSLYANPPACPEWGRSMEPLFPHSVTRTEYRLLAAYLPI